MQAREASNAFGRGEAGCIFSGRRWGTWQRFPRAGHQKLFREHLADDPHARKAPLRGLNGSEKVCNLGTARATLSPRGSTGGSLENETVSYVPRGVRR